MKESDIEAAFVEHLKAGGNIEIIGRQVPLPFGIVDVLGIEKENGFSKALVVVEVKKGAIDLAACGQLFGYLYQIETIIANRLDLEDEPMRDKLRFDEWENRTRGILVGSSIDKRVRRITDFSSNSPWVSDCYYKIEDGKIVFDSDEPIDPEIGILDPRLEKAISESVAFRKQHTASLRKQIL